MAKSVVVFKILFLILIAHSFSSSTTSSKPIDDHDQLDVSIDDKNATNNTSHGDEAEPEEAQRTTSGRWTQAEDEPHASRADYSLESAPNETTKLVADSIGSSRGPTFRLQTESSSSAATKKLEESTAITTTTTTTSKPSDANYADLCYLSDGSSSLTLTVNEATQVGAQIGSVEVNGEPSLDSSGNIDLLDGFQLEQMQLEQPASSNSLQRQRLLSRQTAADLHSAASTANHRRQARPPPPPPPAQQQQQVGSYHQAPFYSLIGNSHHQPAANPKPQQQQQPPIRLEPGTKNLILARPLDKESSEAESSLSVSVKCRPRMSQANEQHSLSFTTIPIRILITDANDHAPEFVGQLPYVINISESASVGSVATREIQAIDRDHSAGPHSTIHYRVLAPDEQPQDKTGDEQEEGHSTARQLAGLFSFTNPLEPILLVAKQLDYETMPSSFRLTILAQDQAEPEPLSATAQVQINLLDFDDQNPKFLDEKYSLLMDEQQANSVGQNLRVSPRSLKAEDGDRGINAPVVYSFDQLNSAQQQHDHDDDGGRDTARTKLDPLAQIDRYLHLNPTTGELRLIRQWPVDGNNNDDDNQRWLSPITLVVRATQADNRDRYALTTLTISRGTQANSLPSTSSATASQADRTTNDKSQSYSANHRKAASQGIAFAQDRLTINVPEDTPTNEKIGRVRAQHLGELGPASKLSSRTGEVAAPSSRTAVGPLHSDNQQVDLVQVLSSSSRSNKTTPTGQRSRSVATGGGGGQVEPPKSTRPISYQILDDQADQFGVNTAGEIYLKRQLDFELKQEHKFSVLATYTKYSDICQVKVNVLNVNDNKPKFTQSQYSFHLTESRLRNSNLIVGQVQAHDLDLNDTVRYSILAATTNHSAAHQSDDHAGQRAKSIFEINSLGQLSLKPGTRQLNSSYFQLIVQANDSLDNANNSHQARVSLHISPQLIGRSINLNAQAEPSEHQPRHGLSGNTADQVQAAPSTTSSSLTHYVSAAAATKPLSTSLFLVTSNSAQQQQQQKGRGSNAIAANQQQQQQPVIPSSQRSSLATVMSSFQHMMRSVNFFEMPMSSALLLSALLAFLICLLLIVVISMSVHLYRRRSKSKRRRRHQLAAAAHLRQHAHMAATGNLVTQKAATVAALADQHRRPSSSTSNSTSASIMTKDQQPQRRTSASNNLNRKYFSNQSTTNSSPTTTSSSASNSNGDSMEANGNSNANPKPEQTMLPSHSTSNSKFRDIEIDTTNPISTQFKTQVATTKQHSLLSAAPISALSQSSQQSKCSYNSIKTSTSDGSSVMNNCGHYSVNGTLQSQQQQQLASSLINKTPQLSAGNNLSQMQKLNKDSLATRNSIEAAIRSLVRQEQEQDEEDEHEDELRLHRRLDEQSDMTSRTTPNSKQIKPGDQLTVLTANTKPGIKSYRRLPVMNSLVRPIRSQLAIQKNNRVGPATTGQAANCTQSDSAIASDSSNECRANNDNSQGQPPNPAGGLMAMVRQLDRQQSSELPASSSSSIKWPMGDVFPQKVKRLTWDDELSCCPSELSANMNTAPRFDCSDDCFVAADIELAGPISPLSRTHQYVEQQQQQRVSPIKRQQLFLFSPSANGTPISPNLNYNSSQPSMGNGTRQADNHHCSSSSQNNCLDYTIVQSSQFQVDSLLANVNKYKTTEQLNRLAQTATNYSTQPNTTTTSRGDEFSINRNHSIDLSSSSSKSGFNMTTAVI